MNTKVFSPNLVRFLVIVTLTIPLALGGLTPVLALAAEGGVVGWGQNNDNQIDIPAGLTDVIAISAGATHSLALKSDGTVVGWGSNYFGQAIPPSDLTGVLAIEAARQHSLALKEDGTVVGWGSDYFDGISIPEGLVNVTAISSSNYHSLALKSDGTVVAWGLNNYGQASVPDGLAGVTAVAAGGVHSLALKDDGTVVGWGEDSSGESSPPAGLTGVIAIAAGAYHSLALKSDGTVVGWGWNVNGEVDIPAGLTNVIAISSGEFNNLALKEDGTVVTWGSNYYGEGSIPAGLVNVIAISAGGGYSLALIQPGGNTTPNANPGGPYLGAVNTSINFDGSQSSDPEGDPLTYAWDFGDGSATGTGMTPTYSYTAAGVYLVCLTVNDGTVGSDPACTIAVVYDPSAGFVTGGGWIDSPTGAYTPDPSLTGQATFGFVSKYKKGATVPTGTTQFQFSLADLSFYSETYEWLVVNKGGTNAQFKGIGLINGAADPNGNAYKFMLWAGDGKSTNSADTFRIRIWWEDAAGEHDVYDNGVAQAIGAGSIVVHTSK